MKKGKVLGKGQIAVAVMLVALGAAVWLNTKYLGEASYVSKTENSGKAVETSAKAETEKSYFDTAKKSRQKAKDEAEDTVKELLKTDNLTEKEKETALGKIKMLADNIEKENNIETLLNAKGFSEALAVIGDSGISIVVKSEGLTSAQTLQIQDIVTNETKIPLGNIKIIPVVK